MSGNSSVFSGEEAAILLPSPVTFPSPTSNDLLLVRLHHLLQTLRRL